jgi:hypothetical protein
MEELVDRLDVTTRGYLALLGSPGSGKSTLLTETLRSRPDRVIRYYAYVPDSVNPGRGEATNFLHDMVVLMERAGIRVGQSAAPGDRLELAKRFHLQLVQLHQDWISNRRKTILLVDGLDHIDREQHPERSLLLDLPDPGSVPEGVVILLGSQTDQLPDLPTAVQFAIQEPERRVVMQPLSVASVLRIVERTTLKVLLTAPQLDRIVSHCEGHPLSLGYLLNRLKAVEDGEGVDSVLRDEVSYSGDIKAQYQGFWRKHVANEPKLRLLLGRIACLRSAIDLPWIERWTDEESLYLLRERAHHFFREEGERWYFHHNSFRLFLRERAAERYPGRSDPAKLRAVHTELAEFCEACPDGPWGWDAIYHRYHSGDLASVIELATQKRFRDEFYDLRPSNAILEDIALGIRAASERRDFPALANLLLANVECSDRAVYLEEIPFSSLLFKLGNITQAIAHAREGNSLRIDQVQALELSKLLAQAGWQEEGRKLFELSEPIDVLSSGVEIELKSASERRDPVEVWAETACYFRQVEETISTIRRLRFRQQFGNESTTEYSRHVQNHLLFEVGLELLAAARWEDASLVVSALSDDSEEQSLTSLWLDIRTYEHMFHANEVEQSRAKLREILGRFDIERLGKTARIVLGEAAYRILGDFSLLRRLLDGVEDPEFKPLESFHDDEDWRALQHLFRFNRLRFVVGDRRPYEEVIPPTGNPRLEPSALLMRDIVRLSRISARAWVGDVADPAYLMMEIRPTLRRFNFNRHGASERIAWHSLFNLREQITELLISCVSAHGTDAVRALCTNFEQEWTDKKVGKFWHSDLRRSVVLALAKAGADTDWVASHLNQLEDRLLEGLDAHSRVNACKKQIDAYLAVDDQSGARRLLDRVVRVGLGVGYRKDFQLDSWLDWLEQDADLEPEELGQRVDWYARAIVSMRETTEGAYRSASVKLVEIVARRDPRWAGRLITWFHQHRVLSHEDALATVLRCSIGVADPPSEIVLAVTAFVLIPYARSSDSALVDGLMKALERGGQTEVKRGADIIFCEASRFAFPAARQGWLRDVTTSLRALGISHEDTSIPDSPPKEREASVAGDLILQDGSRFSRAEMEGRLTTASDVIALLKREKVGEGLRDQFSQFDWRASIRAIAPFLNVKDVRAIAQEFRSTRRESFVLVTLAERALALGHHELAWQLGSKAVELSALLGWDRMYDGGSRLAAYRCLVSIDAARGREEAWKAFQSDLKTESYVRSRALFSLAQLAEVLCGETPVKEVYPLIDEHVRSLFSGLELPEDGPGGSDGHEDDRSYGSALLDLLKFHMTHPAVWVAQSAFRCVGHLLVAGEPTTLLFVRRMLNEGPEELQEFAVTLLDALSFECPDCVRSFQPEILSLAGSAHYGTRRAVKELAERLSWELPESRPRILLADSRYKIELPASVRTPRPSVLQEEDGTRIFPSDASPFEIVYPQHFIIDAIAQAIGASSEQLYLRTVGLMDALDLTKQWDGSAEGRLQSYLVDMGPGFTYRRPKFTAVRRAIHHLVSELHDSGQLSDEYLSSLDSILRYYDPELVLARPSSRPAVVDSLGPRDLFRSGWLEQVDQVFERLARTTGDGSVVLAEHSQFVHPVWERYVEERKFVLRVKPPLTPQEGNSIFNSQSSLLIRDYREGGIPGIFPPIVIRNEPWGFDSPCSTWLALNPFVGRELGWTLSAQGLFRWVDSQGQVMAESVWWVDGTIAISPFHDDQTGEGYLVIATGLGWEALRRKFPYITACELVRRSLTKEREEHEAIETRTRSLSAY